MPIDEVRQELIERYNATGRVGLARPASYEEAVSLIETITKLYEEDEKVTEYSFTLKEVTDKLKEFLNNF